MPEYHDDLLSTAQRLVRRRKGQRGKLSAASVRRSVSTAYYALFHFVLDQATRILVGTGGDLRRRRRILGRLFSYMGIRTTFDKVRGPSVDKSVEDFLRPRGAVGGPVASPHFARELASAFSDAQAKRHDSDYDLNKPISEADARVLISRVRQAIDAWQASDTPADRDFKRAICTLMLLKGQLRQER